MPCEQELLVYCIDQTSKTYCNSSHLCVKGLRRLSPTSNPHGGNQSQKSKSSQRKTMPKTITMKYKCAQMPQLRQSTQMARVLNAISAQQHITQSQTK